MTWSRHSVMTDRRRQRAVALLIRSSVTLLMLVANVVNYAGEGDGVLETMERRFSKSCQVGSQGVLVAALLERP
jgi:hypothetical protein